MQANYYSEDAGGMPPTGRSSGSGQMNPRGGSGSGQMQPKQWSGGNNSPGMPGGGDIQHAAALSAMAGGGGGGGGRGDPSQTEYLAEFEAWKKANSAATYQQQQDYMSDLQGRVAKARMALAGMQLGDNAGDSGDYGVRATPCALLLSVGVLAMICTGMHQRAPGGCPWHLGQIWDECHTMHTLSR